MEELKTLLYSGLWWPSSSTLSLEKLFQQLIRPTEEKTNLFVQSECASFLLASTRSHWALLRWHKQPSARSLPRGTPKTWPQCAQVNKTRAACLHSVGLDSHTAQRHHHPLGPHPVSPGLNTTGAARHTMSSCTSAAPAGLVLGCATEAVPSSSFCGGQSNPRPSAISKKMFQHGAPGRTSHIVPAEMHTSPKDPWTILRFLKVLAQPLCCSQGYREFLLNCHRHLTVRNCLHHSGGSHGPFKCCTRS